MVRTAANRIVFGYGALALAWLFVTDTILTTYWSDLRDIYGVGLIKGLVFVVVSTLALHVLVRHVLRRHERDAHALRNETLRMQTAVRAGDVGLWDWNIRTGAVEWSPELKAQLGYKDNEIDSSFGNWSERLHPDDRDRTLRAVQVFRGGSEPTYRIEYRLRHRDGSYRWMLSQATVFRDDRGTAVRMMGSHVDITERKRLEERLAQARKMEAIANLSGALAHDFNNHLAVIMGNLDLLKERVEGDAEATRFVDQALHGTLRSAQLSKNLLAFSRRQPLNPSTVDANQRLAGNASFLTGILGGDISLKLMPSAALTPVSVDPAQFDSAVVNLVENARDAMPSGGTVTIAVRNVRLDRVPEVKAGDYVAIEVTDTGTGMRPEVVDHAFEPFFTTKSAGRGTGLGLSMVYGFIKQSGGEIAIESEVGRGTTVKIFLPRARGDAIATVAGDTWSPPIADGKEAILVVDDDADVRRTAVSQLASLGYRIVEAENGDAALAILVRSGERFDLLFTDVVMPGALDGPRLAREAVEIQPGLKVLLASGFTGDSASDAAPATQYRKLTKPYRKTDLARAVRDALDR